ncbi:AraC family transcriptional regulator [Chryseobacterium sp.]|uniref:helix-turn-helix domain-containing protein n=1 Tax=Chryseobacterium sp. TaxID=1871047 RepID=UPI0028A23478|nr:AraC family transcriptional regulator [Chryseobacterium sp.]
MSENLQYELVKPDSSLVNFVYCFSRMKVFSAFPEGIIIPNGRIDLIFYKTKDGNFNINLMGLETEAKETPEIHIDTFFAISFNPLALEYMLHESIAEFVNTGKELSKDFLGFNINDLDDFEKFCLKATEKLKSLLPKEIDERKRKLFQIIFENNGEVKIKELAEKIGWSERQINRYFTKQLGISLKMYCNILRFQASLIHIRKGELFPQKNYTDQSHFIKEIKKISGVSPKELQKNQNDRFLQFLMFCSE